MVERQMNLQGMSTQDRREFLSNPDNLPDLDPYEEEVLSAEIGRLSIYYNVEKLDKPDEFIDEFEDKFNKTARGETFLDKVADGLSVYTYIVKHDKKSIQAIDKFRPKFRIQEVGVSVRTVSKRVKNRIAKTTLYLWQPIKTQPQKRIKKADYEGVRDGKIRQIRYADQYGNNQVRYFNGKHFMRSDLAKHVLSKVGFGKNIQRTEVGEL